MGKILRRTFSGAYCSLTRDLERDRVPTDQTHRPDGYWMLHEKVTALEVELSYKVSKEYYNIGQFYEWNKEIDAVIWVVQSEALKKKMLFCFEKAQVGRIDAHYFATVNEFLKNGWATLFQSRANKSFKLENRLGRIGGGLGEVPPFLSLLNCHKWVSKTVAYGQTPPAPVFPLTPISSNIGISPS